MTDGADLVQAAPSEPSLYAAARALAEAAGDPLATQAATRSCALSLEYHLDTLARELARPGKIDPRLLYEAERTEMRMRQLLVLCWSMERRLVAGEPVGRDEVTELAAELQRAASEEIALVFDQLAAPGGGD
jgi:hypothetical protein